MKRAIITAWHKYTPYGGQYYQPIFDYYVKNMTRWSDEFDKLYLLDSTWEFTDEDRAKLLEIPHEIIKVNSSLRYYDAYKEVLPQVTEDAVLFLDNDTVIYRAGIIDKAFLKLDEGYGVATIYDTIGDYKTDKLNGKNKFCPYFFCAKKDFLMKYRDIEWGPNMPEHETFGKLTEKILDDGVKPYEFEEDKSSLYFDKTQGYAHGKGTDKALGYYHVRAGSVGALLLAWRENAKETYEDYMNHQPLNEILRHLAWYWHMGGDQDAIYEILDDIGIIESEWIMYCIEAFPAYHTFL